ncbi:hypothetical protein EGX98_10985 [Fusobacterium necrophorum]|uniref:Integrase catalytic domain-containing protein n=2 Tax=Fusobacterium necrophorum TaxID=859 RepID=A0AB73BVM2_9FUSO|nr:hypothetical protein EGX98_10985 [Fusobacterium necrophorum]KDE61187.1 hypothetical protein FUSO5_12220 [Fusobacterium necrophorum BFTR-1]KDE62719.1 hypothetical protein FUSO3_07125 [Fusobacterium necrophorum BL]KDE71779.1 hypothetical protein FUSO8_07550 [Fusobacterium necrophorum DJ-2]KDE74306.1 hypothetical protein FUSO7_03510 [Fusobacterium necrophorum BFTR-2]
MGFFSIFADPYCAWQRGSNENSNALLREFFSKKTDLGKVSTDKLFCDDEEEKELISFLNILTKENLKISKKEIIKL